MRISRLLWVAAMIGVLGGCGPRATVLNSGPATAAATSRSGSMVPRYGKFELELELALDVDPSTAEPFADFVSPSGRLVRVYGFPSKGKWRWRFSPSEVGSYRYEVRAVASGSALASGRFDAVSGSDRGFVRIDPTERHRLRFEDRTPFFVLGENRINIYDPSWNYQQKSPAEYIAYMAENGMNTLRIFVVADRESEERAGGAQPGCIEPKLGQFDENVAQQFDEIFAAAEVRGIYVIMTAFAIGFTPNETWKSWEDNPYYAGNGGPAKHNWEVFTRPDLRQASKRKLRYLQNRYGYSTHLLAIDLLNEPEWDGPIPERVWIPWAEDLAKDWKERDPYGHLVTVGPVGLSHNLDGDEAPIYASPNIDLVQWHLYGEKTYEPHAHALEMARRVKETWAYNKPVFCGEFAYGGEDPAFYDHTHTGLWAATFTGAGALAHSAPPFNIDSDELMTPQRAKHFQVLAEFLRTLPTDRRLEPNAQASAGPRGTSVFALGTADFRALWVLGPKDTYGNTVNNALVDLESMPAGSYRVEWIDDVSGSVVASENVAARGRLSLKVPAFRRHLAARVSRLATPP